MKRLTIILLFFASVLQGQTGAGYWYGSTEPGTITPEPDTLTLTYWNDFILLHIANTGITETGSGVSEWQDRSGNGNHSTQTVDTNRPTVDGSGNVVFDGVDNYLIQTALALDSCTFFVVFEATTPTIYAQNIYNDNYATGNNSLGFDSVQVGGVKLEILWFAKTADGGTSLLDTIEYNTTYLFSGVSKEADEIYGRINSTEFGNTDISATTYSPAGTPRNKTSIGSFASETVNFFKGIIKFIGIANRKFTPAEIATTETELNTFFTIY